MYPSFHQNDHLHRDPRPRSQHTNTEVTMLSSTFANDRAVAQPDLDIIPGTEIENSTATLETDGSFTKTHV